MKVGAGAGSGADLSVRAQQALHAFFRHAYSATVRRDHIDTDTTATATARAAAEAEAEAEAEASEEESGARDDDARGGAAGEAVAA